MKTKLLLLVSLSVFLGACSTEESLSPQWGIDYSSESTSSFAMGSVDQYQAESKTSYIVKMANLRSAGDDIYSLSYTFESGDALELRIVKRVPGSDYTFPGDAEGNQLLSATFNGQSLRLVDSKVSIQPRTEENKLATATKLQTSEEVVFDGTIGRVPLVK